MRTFNGIGTTIYGRARKQELQGTQRLEAEQSGYLPYTYQVVKWFVFLFMPVAPLGTYRVMKANQRFWTLDSPQYKMVQVPWDWAQIARHYAIAWSWIVALVLLAIFS